MADLDYIYSPIYGVEPFALNGGAGGALLTSHNLVVTLWELDAKLLVEPILDFGKLLQPISQNDNVLPQKRAAGVQAMNSRYSAQVFLQNKTQPASINGNYVFVLNPPPELRQQLAQAVVFNGGNPADLTNYTVKKSLQGGYVWRVEVDTGMVTENSYTEPRDHILQFGTYLELGNYDGIPVFPIPLLKTSGADGQTPEFFDRTTAQGVQEMIAAVNAGNFFVPLLVFTQTLDAERITITWPHSTARG